MASAALTGGQWFTAVSSYVNLQHPCCKLTCKFCKSKTSFLPNTPAIHGGTEQNSKLNDVYIPQQVNNQLNFKAYIGVKETNYVMTIENIPTYKPNSSGIVWKDGEFLKIS